MNPSPLTRRRAKELVRLSRKRHRDESGEYLIEGVRAVESALAANADVAEIVVTPASLDDDRVQLLLSSVDVPVWSAEEQELRQIADTSSPQGLVAIGRQRWVELSDATGAIVALDAVQDPGNVGAIVRSAAWFGVKTVLVGPGTADPFGPKTVRASMGGLWDVALVRATDLGAALDVLRARGYRVVAADTKGEPLAGWSAPDECVLVMGSEAHGISHVLLPRIDEAVTIGERSGAGVESLNVAVAAGIIMHHWLAR